MAFIFPSQLNNMITQIKEAVTKASSECDLVIKRMHLYFDMKLVTFGIEDDSDLTIQFLVFV